MKDAARLRWPFVALLAAVFVAEFILFDQFGSRRHTGVYPRWNDQIQYLSEAYTGYEFARTHGLAPGLWQALINPSAQGTLHDVAAIAVFTIAGPSRSAALALNLLALIAWQAALFLAVWRRGGSSALALAAALLPAALAGPWANIPGSAYDFRLDHLAMCALGVTSAAALLTERFRSRAWSIVFGTMVGLTLSTRFLTGTYFVVIFAGLLAWILAAPERKRRGATGSGTSLPRRVFQAHGSGDPCPANLALAAVAAFVIAAPFFWLNREWVWNYYVIGHYIGPESAIRNQNMGVGRSLAFVGTQLGQRHLGAFFGWIAVALALAAAWFRCRPAAAKPQPSNGGTFARDAWSCGLIFLGSPALVLTIHQQKSEVVISALAPGAILVVVGLLASLARHASVGFVRLAAAGVTISTLGFFTRQQRSPAHDAAALAELRQVNTLADHVFNRARAARLASPRVAADYITDALDGQVLRVVVYERHRVWLPFEMTLPTGIAEPADALVLERLAQSDFVFLADGDTATGPYPYDRKLAALQPQLRAWCEQHLIATQRFTLFGRRMVLYERR